MNTMHGAPAASCGFPCCLKAQLVCASKRAQACRAVCVCVRVCVGGGGGALSASWRRACTLPCTPTRACHPVTPLSPGDTTQTPWQRSSLTSSATWRRSWGPQPPLCHSVRPSRRPGAALAALAAAAAVAVAAAAALAAAAAAATAARAVAAAAAPSLQLPLLHTCHPAGRSRRRLSGSWQRWGALGAGSCVMAFLDCSCQTTLCLGWVSAGHMFRGGSSSSVGAGWVVGTCRHVCRAGIRSTCVVGHVQ